MNRTEVLWRWRKKMAPVLEPLRRWSARFWKRRCACHFTELVDEGTSYVLWCRSCGGFQLFFSGLIFLYSQKEAAKWLLELEEALRYVQLPIHSEPHHSLLPTPRRGVHLYLSPSELEQLHHLLQAADNEVRARALLNLFHQ